MSTSRRVIGLLKSISLIMLLYLSNCVNPIPLGLIDEDIENISLEKAQSLVPFTICVPTYIPEAVNPDPNITYHADWGDPVESQVRLRYSLIPDKKTAIEIFESHSPGVTGLEFDRSTNSQKSAIRGLIDWQIEDNSEIDRYLQEINVSSLYHTDDGTVWWLFMIADPPLLRSNMVDWLVDPVYYVIYTILAESEIENIARSMITKCNNNSSSQP